MAFILQKAITGCFQHSACFSSHSLLLQFFSQSRRSMISYKSYSILSFKHCQFGVKCSQRKLSADLCIKRSFSEKNVHSLKEQQKLWNKTALYYSSALTIFVVGFTYASVLLYRIYCQSTGKGGQAIVDENSEHIISMKPVKNRYITVNFCADTNSALMWNFKPQHPNIKVYPGETALAFYTAKNPTDKAITGIATYNVLPYEAGKYFNKIQCFCFEEQQLNPNEEVDMPVFFYLDPEFANDPWLENVNDIILSYTFFEAKKGFVLTRPSFT